MSEEKLIQHNSQEQTPEEPLKPIERGDVFDDKYKRMKKRLFLQPPERSRSNKQPSPRGSVAGFDNAFEGSNKLRQ